MQHGDEELLARGRRGEQAAFAALVERHGRYLYGVARSLVRDDGEAEDVVQETFIAALTANYAGQAAVRTWLVGIVVRQAALSRRRRSRWWFAPWSESEPAQEDRRQAASDARMDLAAMLARLAPEHREVLILRELEGLSYDAIAHALGLPRGTVESRLHRAREQLRQALRREEPS